jgi:hypothetical protein
MPFSIVAVEELPWPHNPYKCGLFHEFSREKPMVARRGDATVQAAFARFVGRLSPEDLRRCPYHQADWSRAAELAVQLLERGVMVTSLWGVEDALPHETEAMHTMVRGFFGYDAVRWDPSSPTLTNGQHRVCALKALRAERCVVAIPCPEGAT